jgi:hypothetical protein
MPTQGSLRSPWAIQIKPLRGFLSSGVFRSPGRRIVPGFFVLRAFHCPGLSVLRATHPPGFFVFRGFRSSGPCSPFAKNRATWDDTHARAEQASAIAFVTSRIGMIPMHAWNKPVSWCSIARSITHSSGPAGGASAGPVGTAGVRRVLGSIFSGGKNLDCTAGEDGVVNKREFGRGRDVVAFWRGSRNANRERNQGIRFQGSGRAGLRNAPRDV